MDAVSHSLALAKDVLAHLGSITPERMIWRTPAGEHCSAGSSAALPAGPAVAVDKLGGRGVVMGELRL